MRGGIILLLNFLFAWCAFGQVIPNSFRWPVDTEVVISGNFAELRLNHLHYGIDITTGGKEGLRILAADDGWVSRVKIGTGGYGKVVYIDHPNGYTTVYGHLRSIEDSIGKVLLNMQYANEQFEVEYYPKKNEFPVKKGQLIGFSGNTGFSAGPHLHFEIRQSSTEKIINPELFGLIASDTVPPEISGIGIDPLGPNTSVNHYPVSRKFSVKRKKGKYKIESKDTIFVAGSEFGISIRCWDKGSKKNSRNGVYAIEMYVDEILTFSYKCDSFSFAESRGANAHMDYAHFLNEKEMFERCYTLPCDPLTIYGNQKQRGRIVINNNAVKNIRIVLKDYKGNKSYIDFPVKVAPGESNSPPEFRMYCDSSYRIVRDFCKLTFPPQTFYDHMPVQFVVQQKVKESLCFTANVVVYLPTIPAHEAFELSLPVPAWITVPESKLTIVRLDDKGKRTYAGGTIKDGWISDKMRTFGRYALSYDTIAPRIKPPPSSGWTAKAGKTFNVKVADDLSGLNQWRIELNGKWILSEYEPKTGLVFIPGSQLKKGVYVISIEVTDKLGNSRKLQSQLKVI